MRAGLLARLSTPAVAGLTWGSARILERCGARAVYLRGSRAREDSRPLRSDVDLGLLLAAAPPSEEYARSRRLALGLDLARLLNPLLRDFWQFVADPDELARLRRHWPLTRLDEWVPVGEASPLPPLPRADASGCLVGLLNRQYQWCERAFTALGPGLSPGALAAAARKALSCRDRIRGISELGAPTISPPPASQPPRAAPALPRTEDALLALLVESLRWSSIEVARRVPDPGAPEPAEPLEQAGPDERLKGLRNSLNSRLPPPLRPAHLSRSHALVHLVFEAPPDPDRMRGLIPALRACAAETELRLFLHTPETYARLPPVYARRALDPWAAAKVPPYALANWTAEAIFLPGHLRLLSRRGSAQGLRGLRAKALQATLALGGRPLAFSPAALSRATGTPAPGQDRARLFDEALSACRALPWAN